MHKATEAFKKGTELMKAKKFVPALDAFKQSYALVSSPNSHLYIARCLAALGEARSAWLEFDRTADEATAGGAKYAETHDSALQERDELSAKLALVTVVVQPSDPAMTVRVGAFDVPPDRWGKPYPVDPGATEVTVQLPGKPPIHQPVNVSLGERRDVALNAGPAAAVGPVEPPESRPAAVSRPINGLRIGAYVAGGVGVIGFILLGAEGAASKSTYDSLNLACNGKQGCPNPVGGRANADQLISSGKSQQTLANVGLGIGIVGLAAGATLFVLSMRRAPPSDAGPSPAAELVVGPSWAGARGTF